jgi:hypothetical protein
MRAPGGRAAATIVVLAATLAGCTSSGSSEPEKESAVVPSRDTTDVPPVEEALGLLSRGVGLIDFRSDRHSAERLGLLDDGATSHAELGATYADRAAEVPRTDLAAVSQLAREVDLMTEGGAAFSQIDVRWSMRASTGDPLDDDSASVEVFRLVDGVDMEEVLADLEDAGFERSEQGGWHQLHLDGTLSENVDVLDGNAIAGRYPRPFFPDVSVHPETHLVAFGDVGVLDPSGSSGVADALAAVLPGDLGDLEVLAVTPAAHVTCYEPVVKTTNYRATPRTVAAWARTYGIEDLGLPGATLLASVPGEDVVHRSFFTDADAAQQAIVARRRVYAQARRDEEVLGVLMPDGGNDSPYEPGWTMTRTDRVIEVRHNRTDPAAAVDTYLLHGLGFDTCGAPGMFS